MENVLSPADCIDNLTPLDRATGPKEKIGYREFGMYGLAEKGNREFSSISNGGQQIIRGELEAAFYLRNDRFALLDLVSKFLLRKPTNFSCLTNLFAVIH